MASAAVSEGDEIRDAVSWRRAHEELVRLARIRAGLDFEEGRWLLRAFRAGAHVELGYASFHGYTERLFGYGPRLTKEKMRVAEALEELTETARELQSGSISFSTARELTRVAIPSTEQEWLAATRGRTVRDVEQLVSGHRPGSRPDDVPDSRVKRHVLRLEVSGETLAIFRDALAQLRRDAGAALDDDSAILLLCRNALGGSRDEGRSSYQVALTVCERCRQGVQHGRGEAVEVAPEVVDMAECDGQQLGHVETRVAADAHVGSHEQPVPSAVRSARAKQTIPPALRRQVRRRDGGRCRVPGCRHATFVDVHHLQPRSEGGTNTLDNLITLCGAHHRALHARRLLSEGTPASGLTFSHAEGTAYGSAPSPAATDVRAKAYRALIQLGFRGPEARRALARIPSSPDRTLTQTLRESLGELASNRR